MHWTIPRPGRQVRLVASVLAAAALSLATVAWASAQTVTSAQTAQILRTECPDPRNCTQPGSGARLERSGCPDPYNCTPPHAAVASRSLPSVASLERSSCPDPKNCTVP